MKNLDSVIENCVIAAGGKGTRLVEVNGNKPKALTLVRGQEIIFDQIEKFTVYGCKNFYILLGYKAELIQSAVHKKFHDCDININFLVEDIPLGSGGSLLLHLKELPDEFLFTYCDIFFDICIENLVRFHRNMNSGLTLVTHPNDHPYDSDLVSVDEEGLIIGLHAHPHTSENFPGNLVNAAFYVVCREHLEKLEKLGHQDFVQDLVPKVIQITPSFAYTTHEILKDIGTPARLAKIDQYNPNLKKDCGEKVIFLDRDGTLNKIEKGQYIRHPSELTLIDGAGPALKRMRDHGFLIVLVTNQPVIARGEVTWRQLGEIHARLDWHLAQYGAFIDYKFVCPHHPHTGYPGEIKSLKIDCNCRKPKIGLFEKAKNLLKIDKAQSWMIGDTINDVEAGKSFGLQTCLLSHKSDQQAIITRRDLQEFVKLLDKSDTHYT